MKFFFTLILFLALGPHILFAGIPRIKVKHKNDVIVMENGDRITGEIKKMEFGVLYLKSDRAVDTLKLDWERVIRVQSIASYEFVTSSREVYIGAFIPDPESKSPPGELMIILHAGVEIQLPVHEVIGIHEMGRSTLSRVNLSLDAGASYTSANKRTQSNLNASIDFRKPKYSTSVRLSSVFGSEPGTTETARHEAQIFANRYLNKTLEAVVLAGFLHDNQQDLQLRTTFGGGLQVPFYESNRTRLYVIGGAVYTKENYIDQFEEDRNNAEALGALGFSTYHFRGSSFNAFVSFFPSISDPGRLRIDTNVSWKWDIVRDLYWKISLIDNYDNRPPPGGIHSNLSLTTTIGWSF